MQRYSLGTQVHERYVGYMWLPRSRSTSLSNVWERDCVEDSCIDFFKIRFQCLKHGKLERASWVSS